MNVRLEGPTTLCSTWDESVTADYCTSAGSAAPSPQGKSQRKGFSNFDRKLCQSDNIQPVVYMCLSEQLVRQIIIIAIRF